MLDGAHRSGLRSSAFFAFEKQAASLGDLEIVRKIVEREGCLEALEQLLRSASASRKIQAATTCEIEQDYAYAYPQRSVATASPMVVQSLLEQLRSVSVQIVEAIEQWRASTGTQVFQWRQLNYLLKMTSDLDFLAAMAPAVERVDALQHLRLERNPFLAPLHLDHPALREKTSDAAVQLGLWVGSVDMRRLFHACKVLLRELETQRKKQQLAHATQEAADEADGCDDSLSTRDPDGPTMAPVDPSVLAASKQSIAMTRSRQDAPRDRKEEMRRDVELSRELILHAEHELGAIREEVAILQAKLAEALAQPERRRKLQNKIGGLVNALKFRSGDLFQRRNDLHRKEAVYRVACERGGGGGEAPASPPERSHPYLRAVEGVMKEDELRRQEIVEKFMALAKMRVSAASTSRQKVREVHLSRRRASPSKNCSTNPSRQQRANDGNTSSGDNLSPSLSDMTPDEVAAFVDSLDLGSAHGAQFKAQGIDGALLLQATDRDLDELGVSLRLHRVRILEAVQSARKNATDGSPMQRTQL
ncbi:hypothetical protein PybrP1_008755 [[Pythium] brassicae (nom. inval.)]|nr:hypothetical protein PybrP1_008755 [[Pythium] brassicae (nom. inval.)]